MHHARSFYFCQSTFTATAKPGDPSEETLTQHYDFDKAKSGVPG